MQRTQPGSKSRQRRGIIPTNGETSSQSTGPRGEPKLRPDFRDPTPLPHLAQDGFTAIMPAVGTPDLTQVLPRVSPAELLPVHPHTDPVPATALAGTLPLPTGYLPAPAPSRQVLNELSAMPDPARELADAPTRIIQALGGPEPEVKNPAMRLAVRLFRDARDLARAREARCHEADARLIMADARIKAFAERWSHDDAHWDRVARALDEKQNASDAGRLTNAYDNGGTELALGMVEALAHEISRRALTGSAVTR